MSREYTDQELEDFLWDKYQDELRSDPSCLVQGLISMKLKYERDEIVKWRNQFEPKE